ncbi:hypothetical protein [uncultured Flavobacterium sp.]|uniref:hypothetical protein n=1 Tax=uncultured Flavobacterium sp. TaxID=165435 RepID=UPI0025E26D8E|nr:hypothetical protein [uncultured Flavobacterium sp.]
MNKTLQDLINEGNMITFQNNSKQAGYGVFSDASQGLLAWVSRVEDYIRSNYSEDSGPLKMFETFQRHKLTGYEQSSFEVEIRKLQGALRSCESILPNKVVKKDDNVIMSLLKNYLFWTVLVVAVGASYKLGFDNGNSRFDKEKIEMSKENEIIKKDRLKLERINSEKDSLIVELKAKLSSK